MASGKRPSRHLVLAGAGLLSLLLLLAATLVAPRLRDEDRLTARLLPVAGETIGFARAEGPRQFRFPDDLGAHPDYQTEWWYYTGNLDADDERHFGYQLTFFRRALVPAARRQERPSAWATEQVYMAHFALTDVGAGRQWAFERFARGAVGLAGAQASPYAVWLEDWRVEEDAGGTVRLRAAQEDVALDLALVDRKGVIVHGDGGHSRKGPGPGQASYYFGQTRLETSGTVRLGDVIHRAYGPSWMDHEFSTGALSADQVGWDWFALQLDDGSELMVFQIRRAEGGVDPFSSGTLVAPDGTARSLDRSDFEIAVDGTWRSPRSGAAYPARWRVAVPVAGLDLAVEPYLDDQELVLSFTYWEGAVRVSGRRGANPIGGSGYVELTGYAGSMGGRF